MIQFIEQYSQFFQRCNWYDFDILHLQVENDVALGDLELRLVVLGLGFRLVWNYAMTPERQELMDMAEQAREELERMSEQPVDGPGDAFRVGDEGAARPRPSPPGRHS